ncbi:5-hydroxytryptamine receptor 6-like [Paramacrobiotus metropolitanus]|uniref:5-hydroxytryptamine receptor 6-like n=1 Tax=Paramacrobiotus metropolitanus TaxID=2943436 RepID=UPI002445B2DA|nr:5-hydroxytryptamine receptor 6-like [Paramacrobiotus metropolitanus]
MGYLYAAITVFSYGSNVFLLVIYVKSPLLWTPFYSYLISLAVLDLLKSCTVNIMQVSNYLQFHWVFGNELCILFLFCSQSIGVSIIYLHLLICVNRLWAVMSPFSYRAKHKHKLAIGLIMSVTIMANISTIPIYTGDGTSDIRSRAPVLRHLCIYQFGAKPSLYFLTLGALTHPVPHGLIMLLYPIIVWKVRSTVRQMQSVFASGQNPSFTLHVSLDTSEEQVRIRGTHNKHKHILREAKRYFGVLTILFVSSFLFWTPGNVARSVMVTSPVVDIRVLAVTDFLFAMDCTINPLLCLASSTEWRHAAISVLNNIRRSEVQQAC